jgi:hypothetical protein
MAREDATGLSISLDKTSLTGGGGGASIHMGLYSLGAGVSVPNGSSFLQWQVSTLYGSGWTSAPATLLAVPANDAIHWSLHLVFPAASGTCTVTIQDNTNAVYQSQTQTLGAFQTLFDLNTLVNLNNAVTYEVSVTQASGGPLTVTGYWSLEARGP